jgi:hypothetical protein
MDKKIAIFVAILLRSQLLRSKKNYLKKKDRKENLMDGSLHFLFHVFFKKLLRNFSKLYKIQKK